VEGERELEARQEVRRSWLTPFSIVVRCSIARSIRRFISMKA
jgi:hypothetical protein